MKQTKSNKGYEIRRLTGEEIKALTSNDGLIGRLAEAASSGFGSDMTYEDVRDHLLGGDVLYLAYQDENPVGFASFLNYDIVLPTLVSGFMRKKQRLENIPHPVFFLDGIVVGKEHQGKGLGSCMIKEEIMHQQDERHQYKCQTFGELAFRTQSPVMYATVRNMNRYFDPFFDRHITRIYPNSRYGIPLEDSLLAMEIAKRRYGMSLPADFVMRGVRPGVYREVPKHPVADDLFGNVLNVDAGNGDFVFVLAEVRFPADARLDNSHFPMPW